MIVRKRAGLTLIELLVASLLLSIVGAALYHAFGIAHRMHDVVIGQNNAFADARKGIDLMADHLRNAQMNENGGAGVQYAAIAAGAADDVTYYVDSVPNTVRIRKVSDTIELTDNGATTVLATNIQSLTLTFYKLTLYNGTWTLTTNANAPSSAELPQLAGIEIRVQVARDGYTTEYKTMVRLRNSPRKSSLSGI